MWDFALVSVASAMVMNGTHHRAHAARRSTASRRGRCGCEAVEEIVARQAAQRGDGVVAANLAIEGAQPLKFNAYKVPLMRNLVKRAIRGVEAGTWTS